LSRGETGTASKWAGTILAYVQEAGSFANVIEEPVNAYRFEQSVAWITNIVYPSEKFEEKYGSYIRFDGALEIISPYDAIMRIGKGTYEGMKDGSCSAEWMDGNYDLENEEFVACAGRNFNNIVNAEVDVLHTIYHAGVNNLSYELYAYDWSSDDEEDALSCSALGGEVCEIYEVCLGNELDASDSEYCCEGVCGSEEPEEEPSDDGVADPVGDDMDDEDTAPEDTEVREVDESNPLLTYIIAVLVIIVIVLMTLLATRKPKKKSKKEKKPLTPKKNSKKGSKTRKYAARKYAK
jgi:hypothetical protein